MDTVHPLLCLLPSPLLGPTVWRPVADELAAMGWATTVAARTGTPPQHPHDVVEAFLEQIPGNQPVVLIPHSNAGLYVPTLASGRSAVAAVFVDAGLPPGAGTVPVAPPALYAFLEERVGPDGLLPPWTQWWDDADVAPLFGSDAMRRAVEQDQQRIPLSYFSHRVDVPQGWGVVPGAYLAFGDTYGDERAQAQARGWPVRTLDGNHLHMVVDPQQVAAEIVALLSVLGLAPGTGHQSRDTITDATPRLR